MFLRHGIRPRDVVFALGVRLRLTNAHASIPSCARFPPVIPPPVFGSMATKVHGRLRRTRRPIANKPAKRAGVVWSALTCQRFSKRRLVAAPRTLGHRDKSRLESGNKLPHSRFHASVGTSVKQAQHCA